MRCQSIVIPKPRITAAFKAYWNERLKSPERLDQFHTRVGVEHRHFSFPMERYPQFASFGETNDAWFEVAQELGAKAIDAALDRAGLCRQELNALFFVSVTGIASPSLDARLINRLGLRRDIKRTPIFGIGCAGGAIGLTRAADYLLAYPDHNAALLAVELLLSHDPGGRSVARKPHLRGPFRRWRCGSYRQRFQGEKAYRHCFGRGWLQQPENFGHRFSLLS